MNKDSYLTITTEEYKDLLARMQLLEIKTSLLVIAIICLVFFVIKLYKERKHSKFIKDSVDEYEFNEEKAEFLYEKGDIKTLINYCDDLSKKYPNSVRISWYYAVSYYDLRNYDLARLYFNKVVKINPLWRDIAYVYLQEIDVLQKEKNINLSLH